MYNLNSIEVNLIEEQTNAEEDATRAGISL